jgi:hypothetical protein
MNKLWSKFNLLAALAVYLLGSSLAQAQATRTWVSGVGDDANPCSRTAPCKTFAGAISKTAAGGEISVLDPGGYGAVTITKAITINGEGQIAGILAAGVNGITVNAGVGDIVVIRNISIHGAGTGLNGIRFLAGKQLSVEHCWIQGFTQNGIDHNTAGANANGNRLSVKDTIIEACNLVGVRVAGSAPKAVLDNVSVKECNIGFDLTVGTGTATNSVFSYITAQAVVAEATSTLNATNCVMSHSGTGVSAFSSGSTVRISGCDILNNTTGINIAVGGTVASFQNNRNAGNTTPGAPNVNIALQ